MLDILLQRDMDAVLRTYDLLSGRWMTHASPTLFNSGTPHPQLSSCFLIAMKVPITLCSFAALPFTSAPCLACNRRTLSRASTIPSRRQRSSRNMRGGLA